MKTRRKQQLVYVALDDPEVPSQGAYLVAIAFGGEDSPASREQAKFELERRFEEELPPFDRYPFAFPNGLSVEQNLIHIPEDFIVARKTGTSDAAIDLEGIPAEKRTEIEAILNGAAEAIAKARLATALAKAHQAALPYADLLRLIFDPSGQQYLTEEQCALIEDKAFAKAIKELAEAKAEMTRFDLTATGDWQLILDCILSEEVAQELTVNLPAEKRSPPKANGQVAASPAE
ncbi:hypothetical protein QQ056_03300 [Oscillatoria laete-virens NRMC-F 0139]|nr:hypothetical protein [Oscillatoria laete-virens]MDL5052589.1 hypothetical protein [Oscillatoria laete-virens NRMC-F 0139]